MESSQKIFSEVINKIVDEGKKVRSDLQKSFNKLSTLENHKSNGTLPSSYNTIGTPLFQYPKNTPVVPKELHQREVSEAISKLRSDLLEKDITLVTTIRDDLQHKMDTFFNTEHLKTNIITRLPILQTPNNESTVLRMISEINLLWCNFIAGIPPAPPVAMAVPAPEPAAPTATEFASLLKRFEELEKKMTKNGKASGAQAQAPASGVGKDGQRKKKQPSNNRNERGRSHSRQTQNRRQQSTDSHASEKQKHQRGRSNSNSKRDSKIREPSRGRKTGR